LGTHDVSLLSLDSGVFEVLATGGNSRLGGEDLDNKMTEFVASEFQKKTKLDIRKVPRAMRRVKTACERAKRSLSSSTTATVEIDSLFDGHDCSVVITRARFEELGSELFKQAMAPVEQVLRDAKVSKDKVDEIVLVNPTVATLEYPGVPPHEINLQRYCVSTDCVVVNVEAVAVAISCHEPPLSILDSHWNTKPCVLPV
jgi:molecular chaperone DnaK (HSP70)